VAFLFHATHVSTIIDGDPRPGAALSGGREADEKKQLCLRRKRLTSPNSSCETRTRA
jgi:hypothetical protein